MHILLEIPHTVCTIKISQRTGNGMSVSTCAFEGVSKPPKTPKVHYFLSSYRHVNLEELLRNIYNRNLEGGEVMWRSITTVGWSLIRRKLDDEAFCFPEI